MCANAGDMTCGVSRLYREAKSPIIDCLVSDSHIWFTQVHRGVTPQVTPGYPVADMIPHGCGSKELPEPADRGEPLRLVQMIVVG